MTSGDEMTGSRPHDPGEVHSQSVRGGGRMTYAEKAGGGLIKRRKKLNVLDIILERRNQEISFTLSKEELAKLLFRKMQIQSTQVSKIDTSAFGKIHVEMNENVKLEKFVELPAFEIREGLRTKFYRPHHRQDTLVKMSWLDLETPDELVMHILSFFGKPKSNIKYCTMKEEDGDSELAKLLNNIPNGERQIWMELNTSLPSYAVIDGRRVKIWHTGQKRTCARCNQEAVKCPGNANARECEENGGIKTNTNEMWMKLLQEVSYQEWDGEETKQVIDETVEDETEPSNSLSECDGIVLSNIEESVEEKAIKDLLKVECNVDVPDVKVEKTGKNGRSRLIIGLTVSSISHVCKKLNKKLFGGKIIHCKPRVPYTPPRANPANKSPKKDEDEETETGPTNTIPGLASNVSKNQRKKQKKREQKKETLSKASDLKTADFLLNSNPGRKTSSIGTIINDVENDFVFSDEESENGKDDEPEHSDDHTTPVKSKEFVEGVAAPAPPTTDLASKRNRTSPEEIRGYKKSRSGSNGGGQVLKIADQK